MKHQNIEFLDQFSLDALTDEEFERLTDDVISRMAVDDKRHDRSAQSRAARVSGKKAATKLAKTYWPHS